MGYHYIPKYYLRGFSLDAETIWQYDKSNGQTVQTNVKNVAQETDYYPDDVEKYLTEKVENPAKPVIEKIRTRTPLTLWDKKVMAAYMVCMLKRVPRAKERVKELAPSVAAGLAEEYDHEFQSLARQHPDQQERLEEVRAYVQEILKLWSGAPPEEAWHRNVGPETAPKAVARLAQMTWRFLLYDRSPAFLTSDNPIFYRSDIGIGGLESEVTFPVSSDIVLWVTGRKDLQEGYYPTRDSVVREVNRRTASITTRFAYHAVREDWVLRLLCRSSWRFNRLV